MAKLTPGQRLISAAQEALSIAKGEAPAASITVKGHRYVPAAQLTANTSTIAALTARAEAADAAIERVWRALEIRSYDEAGGLEISQIVAGLKTCALTAEALNTTLTAERDAALIEYERYLAVAREEGDWRRAAEARVAVLEKLPKAFAIYMVDGEDGVRLSTGGKVIAHWGEHTAEGMALLHLDAIQRAALGAGQPSLEAEGVALALYEALAANDETAYFSPFAVDEKVAIDGRFNLVDVAKRLNQTLTPERIEEHACEGGK